MAILIRQRLLAQRRPASTTSTPLYHPPANTTTAIKTIWICNTTSLAAAFSLFLDTDAANFSDDNSLVKAQNIPANSTNIITLDRDGAIFLDNTSGTFGVKSSVASALTFSIFGTEITET